MADGTLAFTDVSRAACALENFNAAFDDAGSDLDSEDVKGAIDDGVTALQRSEAILKEHDAARYQMIAARLEQQRLTAVTAVCNTLR